MKELTPKEVQWLRIFAENNEFFLLLLEYYQVNDNLTDKQYFKLKIKISDAEDKGKTFLTSEEFKELEKLAIIYDHMSEILEKYNQKGFLNGSEYDLLRGYIEEEDFVDKIKLEQIKELTSINDSKINLFEEDDFNWSDDEKGDIEPTSSYCPKCDAYNVPEAEFCHKCGKSLK